MSSLYESLPLPVYGDPRPTDHKAQGTAWGEEAGASAQDPVCSEGTDPNGLRQLQEENGVAGIVGCLCPNPQNL